MKTKIILISLGLALSLFATPLPAAPTPLTADEAKEIAVDAYRRHQREKENATLKPGVAFPLVHRVLRLNDGFEENDAPVEVVLLSKNDPDTGLRVFNSIQKHKLAISRAGFVNGGNPFRYMNSFNACLFLSANVRPEPSNSMTEASRFELGPSARGTVDCTALPFCCAERGARFWHW
jgi:hypothetical protein